MDYMVAQKKLHKKYLWNLLIHIRNVLKKKASLVDWTIPEEGHFTVCGDIHG
jgi:serine/threonine-protein phosphatase 5